jgi:hypothetical protein
LRIGAGTPGPHPFQKQGFSLLKIRPRYWIAGTAALIGIILTFALFVSLNSIGRTTGQNPPSTASLTPLVEESGPIDLTPKATLDEGLVLFHTYQDLAKGYDIEEKDDLETKEGIKKLRFTVNRYHEYIKERQMDPNLELLYADLLTTLDLQMDFLTAVERIDEDAADRANKDAQDNGFDAGVTVGEAASSINDNGGSGGDALLGGLGAGLLKWTIDDLQKKQELDDDKRRALEDANEQLQRAESPIDARAANAIDDLVGKYNWSKNDERVNPDPFYQLFTQLADQYVKAKTPQEAVAAADALLEGARSVPPGSIYDGWRAFAILYAAKSAYWATAEEVRGQKWGVTLPPSADYAIRLCDAGLLQNGPASMHDEIQEIKAWTLASAGRLAEAQTEANAVFDKFKDTTSSVFFADDITGPFLYMYACLMSCLRYSQK